MSYLYPPAPAGHPPLGKGGFAPNSQPSYRPIYIPPPLRGTPFRQGGLCGIADKKRAA